MDDLKLIKKYYGEKMMHYCREVFYELLDTPGKLFKIMDSSFEHNKYLYDDIKSNKLEQSFREYILRKLKSKKSEFISSDMTPYELLRLAGYTLYECKTEEDIQAFRKYYYKANKEYDYYNTEGIPVTVGEELCTFKGGRLNDCYVFFAIKDGADKLVREKFDIPKREDVYGVSVISIQFTKDTYTLSIKNRYNHTVFNPDNTFKNNLENIIPGLTSSFSKLFGAKINQNDDSLEFEIPGYIQLDNKFYKYNIEINGIYYCPNNTIISGGQIKRYDLERYIVMDYFILDLSEKKITLFDTNIWDSFINQYKNIEKIDIKKNGDMKLITIITKEGEVSKIVINKYNQIILYKNKNLKTIGNNFMKHSQYINYLKLPNLNSMGDCNFMYSTQIEELNLSNLVRMGGSNFTTLYKLKKLDLPKLEIIGIENFRELVELEEIDIPNVERIGKQSFNLCLNLKRVNAPKLEVIEQEVFLNCRFLKEVDLPSLIEMQEKCFYTCNKLKKISLPLVRVLPGSNFRTCKSLVEINIPNVVKIGAFSFYHCESLIYVYLPKTEELYADCFNKCKLLKEVHAPMLRLISRGCFKYCESLKSVILPSVEVIEYTAMYYCKKLSNINLPRLKELGNNCLEYSPILELYLPRLSVCGSDNVNNKIKKLTL